MAAPDPTDCLPKAELTCTAENCQWRCALQVLDELLSGPIAGDEMDHLLDLRWQIRQGTDAERTLRMFNDLRLQMEQRHYLAFFRIRRWLENHIEAVVRVCPAAERRSVPVKLDYYCIEAVRRVCLCAALGANSVLLAPRLQFAYRKLHEGPVSLALAEAAAL